MLLLSKTFVLGTRKMKLIRISSDLILKNVSGERYRYMFKTSGTGALRGTKFNNHWREF